MKFRRITVLVLTLTILFALSACGGSSKSSKSQDTSSKDKNMKASSNLNQTGMPIVKKKITLHFMTGTHPTNASDYNKVLVWKKYEKMSNIHIDWGLVQSDSLQDKRNLSLTAGNYPDVYYSAGVPQSDLLKYGKQGVFIPLNDLIDKYMPNLKKLFKKYPAIKRGLTFPDGNIYSLPTIYLVPSVLSSGKLWVRKDWLNELNMDVPQTTQQFYQYLKGVKAKQPDAIPFGGVGINGLVYSLYGAWGLQDRGAAHRYIDIDPKTKKLRFFPISDAYKDELQYIHKLYSEGLIDKQIFTRKKAEELSLGEKGKYGSVDLPNVKGEFGEKMGSKYTGLPALQGPNGDHMWTNMKSQLAHTSEFVITNKDKYPAATVRWMDYFYGNKGAELYFMGVKGKTYTIGDDGKPQYMDVIVNNPNGLSQLEAEKPYFTWPGGGYPGIVESPYFNGPATKPQVLKAEAKVKPDEITNIWPTFTYTNEESQELAPLKDDIEKYVTESRDKFVSGDMSFSDWDKYVNTIKKMGLDHYMKIKEAAYKRYKNGK